MKKPVRRMGMLVAALAALWRVEAMAAEEANAIPSAEKWYRGTAVGWLTFTGMGPERSG